MYTIWVRAEHYIQLISYTKSVGQVDAVLPEISTSFENFLDVKEDPIKCCTLGSLKKIFQVVTSKSLK